MNDDKPFVCHVADCGMRFTNEDHLNVHSKKHEMSLALISSGQSSNSPAHHFLDQTPTPTKFLKNCEEIGLFQELSSNPFDHAYKKALDSDLPLPGPQSGELNTPTLILTDMPKNVSSSSLASMHHVLAEKNKSTEPLKPSPLTKAQPVSKVMLDLTGKSVMSAQPKLAVKRNFTSQDADSTSDMSPMLDQVMAVSEAVSVRPSGSNLHTQANYSTTLPILPKQESALPILPKQEMVKREMEDGYANPGDQQQCTMQVLLQLPTGETVPISIPATINKLQYFGTQQAILQQNVAQAPILSQASPRAVAPTLGSSQTTTMALKQKLKAQLQSQLSPTSKNVVEVNSATTTSTPAYVATSSSNQGPVLVGDTSPIMMVDSPGSELNFSDSSDYSIDSKRQKMSPESGDPEERRRKFLERNRAAAARCRQKRKHWISNLEKKADELQNTNLRLQCEVKLLRGEVAQLKTLLLAHKDCPVTQQQKSQGQLQHIILTETSLSSQDLAQVVPTSDLNQQALLNQTIVTFLQDNMIGQDNSVGNE
ncbi:cyclic AMP-dependent transcription factor ATF-2 [Biomphalaria glabrata]|uniref:Cyclic AMP-dependent transcription factor ATF-2-like isoform X1 n=1 Tax=Biomphalaria glabrata TaxID=6526 RepID=A0A9W2YB74_BIOGL|nr:cyclic AMP-dependent transcription factor ATF-2-like isoform X1 [Biomphalaria glabrata]XP_055860027.1 cyclic AMP-dependent transcription factor ATF-2-like isoform X1 [Biomphalaria glabrata]XP_055860028.1 cyclic AMP-dependent transcription factor ATF-2-like isoform X1 [Biomphalaria glabrata]KAI8744333.1 cyclic AMP-dependent transcription factor ATF-2-like [Biomphalaria glabrata]